MYKHSTCIRNCEKIAYEYRKNCIGFLVCTNWYGTHSINLTFVWQWCVNILRWCGDHSRMSCVHSRMSCDHSRTGCVHSTHARRRWRLHCAFTAHLLRNVCSAIARRFFLTCSKFDGARSARGVCLAHLGDSTAYVWRTQSVNEDPRAYVAYLPCISYFFRTPCQRSSIAGQWNRGISCQIRK